MDRGHGGIQQKLLINNSGEENMFESKYDQDANTLTFTFSGHMDSARCSPMVQAIENKVTEHTAGSAQANKPLKAVFDLKEVDFISSAFIRICMMILAKVKTGNLIVRNASPFIKKTIKISGLENQLSVL
jgi:anti-anti-sigma factor